MNVLITGGAGFIGSHLAEAMLAGGHGVVVVDDLSTGSLENIAVLRKQAKFQFVRDSVCNVETMTPLIDRCDVVFHLAAAVGVQLIVDEPVRTIETNIHGSEVVLDLASKFGRKILLASSSEVYGKGAGIPFGEDDNVIFGSTRFRRWCYGCSKMVDEFLALAYHDQFGLEAIVCRFFNIVGPRQTGRYGMVVPKFVRGALAGETLRICGSGRQERTFCNVSDLIPALQQLIECPQAVGEVINVGSDEAITIENLAQKVIAIAGSASTTKLVSYEEFYGRAFDDTMQRVPDLAKVHRLISYKSKFSLEQTLRQIVDFERAKLPKD